MSRYGYSRLSKDRSLRGINVAIQRAEIDEYAEDTGDAVTRHLEDNDLSASEFATKPRKGYLELIDDISQGLVTEVIVTEIPRLARVTEHAIELITLSKATPLRFIKTTDGMVYDLNTPRGRKSLRDAVSDAEFESDQTSTRQHRKKNKQAELGRYNGGVPCFGFESAIRNEHGILLNPGRVGTQPVPAEVAVLEEAMTRLLNGERELSVVRDFNTRGITTAAGYRWRAGNLMNVLLKRRYVAFDEFPGPGIRPHKGKEYKAIYPAIFSREQHDELRSVRDRNAAYTRPGRRGGVRRYPYTGLVFCGGCGSIAYGNGKIVRNGQYLRRYVCKKFDNFGVQVGCGRVMRAAEPIEAWVKEALLYRFDTPEIADALAPREDADRFHEVTARLSHLRMRRTQIVDERARGDFDRDDYLRAKQVIDQEIGQLQSELSRLQAPAATKLLPADGMIRGVWDSAPPEWQGSVAALVIEKILIKPVGAVGGARWNGYRFDPDSIEIVWRH